MLEDIETSTGFTSEHVGGIDSVTKVFMSVVILQLTDEGGLGIDDTRAHDLSKQTHSYPKNF